MAVVFDFCNAAATAGYAERCKYVNSVRSDLRKPNSSAFGSLTLTTICWLHASAAVGTIVAPAATYSASLMDAPSPALFSINTSIPSRSNSRTPSGVRETRPSKVLISLGTPRVLMLDAMNRHYACWECYCLMAWYFMQLAGSG